MRLIEAGRPSFFITANTHYAMLTAERPGLRGVNERAAFLLADGAPLVWASRRGPTPLPERVAGSDLVYDLCEHAARLGRRLYLLGGAEGVAEEAARRLRALYPGLVVAGTACPPPGSLAGEGAGRLIAEVRAARPDLLMVALGQPKGELWLAEHLEELGVPVSRPGRGDARLRRRPGPPGPPAAPEDRHGMGLPDLHRPGPAGPAIRPECPVPARPASPGSWPVGTRAQARRARAASRSRRDRTSPDANRPQGPAAPGPLRPMGPPGRRSRTATRSSCPADGHAVPAAVRPGGAAAARHGALPPDPRDPRRLGADGGEGLRRGSRRRRPPGRGGRAGPGGPVLHPQDGQGARPRRPTGPLGDDRRGDPRARGASTSSSTTPTPSSSTPTRLERQYRECRDRGMDTLGVTARWDPFFDEVGYRSPATWELMYSTRWARATARRRPQGAAGATRPRGRHEFDTMLYPEYLDYASGQGRGDRPAAPAGPLQRGDHDLSGSSGTPRPAGRRRAVPPAPARDPGGADPVPGRRRAGSCPRSTSWPGGWTTRRRRSPTARRWRPRNTRSSAA